MTCAEFHAVIHAFFIGELPPERKKIVEDHAETCPQCGNLMKMAYELTCKELVEFLGEYVDGTLPAERKALFERHLSICPECTAYLQSYRRTIELTGSSTESERDTIQDMPDELVRAIVSSLKQK